MKVLSKLSFFVVNPAKQVTKPEQVSTKINLMLLQHLAFSYQATAASTCD